MCGGRSMPSTAGTCPRSSTCSIQTSSGCPSWPCLAGRVYRGHKDVQRSVEDLAPDWEFFEVHSEELRDLGDRVLIFGHWRARGRASGVESEQPATWLYEMKGGKVARMQTFTDRDEGLKAAALRG